MDWEEWVKAGRPHWRCVRCETIFVTIPQPDDFMCPNCRAERKVALLEAPDVDYQYLTRSGVAWHHGSLMKRDATGQVIGPCSPDCPVCQGYFTSRPQLPGMETVRHDL